MSRKLPKHTTFCEFMVKHVSRKYESTQFLLIAWFLSRADGDNPQAASTNFKNWPLTSKIGIHHNFRILVYFGECIDFAQKCWHFIGICPKNYGLGCETFCDTCNHRDPWWKLSPSWQISRSRLTIDTRGNQWWQGYFRWKLSQFELSGRLFAQISAWNFQDQYWYINLETIRKVFRTKIVTG